MMVMCGISLFGKLKTAAGAGVELYQRNLGLYINIWAQLRDGAQGATHSVVHPIVWTSIIKKVHTAQMAAIPMTSVGYSSIKRCNIVVSSSSRDVFFWRFHQRSSLCRFP